MPAYSRDDLEKMADALRSLPAATTNKLNTQAVVAFLAAEILGLQERGYSIDRIASPHPVLWQNSIDSGRRGIRGFVTVEEALYERDLAAYKGIEPAPLRRR